MRLIQRTPPGWSGRSSILFDIKGFFNLLEGFPFFHHDLLFFDALDQVLNVFLRSQIGVTVGKYLSIQVQDGFKDLIPPAQPCFFESLNISIMIWLTI